MVQKCSALTSRKMLSLQRIFLWEELDWWFYLKGQLRKSWRSVGYWSLLLFTSDKWMSKCQQCPAFVKSITAVLLGMNKRATERLPGTTYYYRCSSHHHLQYNGGQEWGNPALTMSVEVMKDNLLKG